MDDQATKRFRIGWFPAACLAALAAAGCAHDHDHDEGAMTPTTQPIVTIPSSVDEFVEVQAAKGAAGDATLYRGHFDGDRLNSLGRAKLALLSRHHETGQRVTIYVDTSDGAELPPARRDAITTYLAHAGVPADDVEVRSGPNTDGYYAYPAAEAIRGLQKTDSDYQSQQPDASMSGPSGSGGGGYGGSGGSNPGR